MTRASTLRLLTIVVGAAVVLLLPWAITSRYQLTVVNYALVLAVVILGLNVAKGYAGLISVGHAGFWGLGAYTAGLLAVKLGWPFALTLPTAVLVTTAIGAVVGIPAVRLKHLYLAMATLAFGLMVSLTALNWHSFTGGASGLQGIPPASLGPFVADKPKEIYYLLLVSVVLAAWFCLRIEATRYGRALKAINGHELAAELMGVDTFIEKVRCFAISAGLAGAAGALYAHTFGFLSPEQFGFGPSVMFMVMLVIGGLGTVPGAIAGVIFFTILPEALRPLRYWQTTIYGLLVMFFILFVPGGFISLFQRWLPWFFPTPAPPEADPEEEALSVQVRLPRAADAAHKTEGPLLTVRDLTVHFGGLTALRDVDLELLPGEIHALIGPNGAGKTTLVNCITGIYRPSSGTVKLFDQTLAGLRPHQVTRLGVARTFQNLALWPNLTLLQNLLIAGDGSYTTGFWAAIFATRTERTEEERVKNLAEDLLRAVGLWGLRDQTIGSLPYGYQKFAEVARALMTNPRVLLLDEPAAGLTRPEVLRLIEIMRAILDNRTAILLIEHNIDLVMDVADRITVLNFGQRVATGVPEVVRQDAAVIEAYLGATELIDIAQGQEARVGSYA